MSQLALLGSSSSHGGKIISASGGFIAGGVRGVLDGDMHQCPIRGHGVKPISATSAVTSNGKRIVRVGDSAACGAVITSGYGNCDSD